MAEIKYEIIRKTIQKEIESGKYQVGDRLPTESNLMETFGVSRYTVRRAISELQNAHYVYRIQGGGMYVDDWQDSQQPPKANNKMIGLVTTHLVDYIFPNIISGIDRIVSAHGYSLIVSNTHNQRENERRSLERLLDTQIAGLIVEPTQSALANTNMDLYQKIAQSHLPMVFINAHYPQLQAPYLEIKDKIIFAGVHKDVENYYRAMDAFVLPSLFEGLPVTGIEAQYSGLPCFFSDEVTREVKICSDTKFLKTGNENLGLWVDAICQQRINKERNKIELITKKFDIRTAAKSMEKRYIDLWKQSNS